MSAELPCWAALDYPSWSDDDVLDCARWWAGELGMCAWGIKASFKPRFKVGGLANTTFNGRTEEVLLRLSPWTERDKEDAVENDLEADVVHELLHARFWSMPQPDTTREVDSQCLELALDRVANALVRQRRRAQK